MQQFKEDFTKIVSLHRELLKFPWRDINRNFRKCAVCKKSATNKVNHPLGHGTYIIEYCDSCSSRKEELQEKISEFKNHNEYLQKTYNKELNVLCSNKKKFNNDVATFREQLVCGWSYYGVTMHSLNKHQPPKIIMEKKISNFRDKDEYVDFCVLEYGFYDDYNDYTLGECVNITLELDEFILSVKSKLES